MSNVRHRNVTTLLRIVLYAMCAVAVSPTLASDDLPQYSLNATKSASASWVLPFDKKYNELSDDDRRRFKSLYEQMGEQDEPPFPVEGLSAIFKPLVKAQSKIQIEGDFFAEARINSSGEVTEVLVKRSPEAAVTNFIVGVIFLTKFKPAVCGGVPCAMGFPVRVGFKVE
jgi:hypothetical protein